MPVSKKRKKEGKPVHRKAPPVPEAAASAPEAAAEAAHGPEPKPPVAPQPRMGRPTNPFVAQQTKRGAQRGR